MVTDGDRRTEQNERLKRRNHFFNGLASGACSVPMFVISFTLRCYCSASQQAQYRLIHGHLSYGRIQWLGCSCWVHASPCVSLSSSLFVVTRLQLSSLLSLPTLPLYIRLFALFSLFLHASFLMSLSPSLILTPPFHIFRTYSSCYP